MDGLIGGTSALDPTSPFVPFWPLIVVGLHTQSPLSPFGPMGPGSPGGPGFISSFTLVIRSSINFSKSARSRVAFVPGLPNKGLNLKSHRLGGVSKGRRRCIGREGERYPRMPRAREYGVAQDDPREGYPGEPSGREGVYLRMARSMDIPG